jgi:hypothetical protein
VLLLFESEGEFDAAVPGWLPPLMSPELEVFREGLQAAAATRSATIELKLIIRYFEWERVFIKSFPLSR